MIKEQVGYENLASGHIEFNLASYKSKSFSEFKQKAGYIVTQRIFKFTFRISLLH